MKSSELEKLVTEINNISSEFNNKIELIQQLEIPTREQQINEIYFKNIEKLKYFNEIQKGDTLKINKKMDKKITKREKIENLINDMEKNKDKIKINLTKILELIPGISEEDKKSLFIQLVNSEISEINAAINQLVQLFEQE